MKNYIPLLTLATTMISCANSHNVNGERPNVIFILADDLGYGDLGCYGQELIETPNIDALAESGMLFTQHYSGSAVSAPSRSVLMSGQHTGHTDIRANRELKGEEGQPPISQSTYTMAELFKDAGYATGGFGKWGLGMPHNEGSALKQGFDTFWGPYCQVMAHRYYPEYIWHNDEKFYLEGNDTKNKVTYAPDVIQEKTLDFIRENKDRPFFAYVPCILPHAELVVPDDEIYRSVEGKFEPKAFINNTEGANYGDDNFNYFKYASQPNTHAAFAAMVMRLDMYVGEIVSLVKELGIEDNTLIIFTSDNGPHAAGGGDWKFFNGNGPFREYKFHFYDGGIRIPMIASWKGHIKPGVQNDHISAFWDFMPTFSELVKSEKPLETDGLSILPTLTGNDSKQAQHEYLYWELPFANLNLKRAVRIGNWKAVQYNVAGIPQPVGEIELYDIVNDQEESVNVASQHPEVIARVKEIFEQAHTPSEMFPSVAD